MITKDNNLKVMELFFKFPYTSFHIREIARLTGLSSTGVIKIIKKLKKEKLLLSKKANNMEEIKPDFNGRFLIIKRLYNIYSIYDSGLMDYIKSYYEMPQSIILFGSYSNGTDTEKSDIDIGVVSAKKEIPDFKKFETRLSRKINLHLIEIKNTPKEFINSLANGIVLEGFVEMVK
ncbi:MAG: nucleotidyltransferase domain-containing protein [Nanoarchaeota archaeon]